MTQLNICFVTFNCGRSLINVSSFAKALPFSQKSHGDTPDIVVMSLQEIAPIAYAFLGGSFLTPYTSRFIRAIDFAKPSEPYVHIIARHLGMTSVLVFAKPEISARISRVETAGVGVGLWEMGNKGAVGVRVAYQNHEMQTAESLTFVAAHLAPSEKSFERRNRDWENIVRGLVFLPTTDLNLKFVRANDVSSTDATQPLLSNDCDHNQDQQTNATGVFRSGSPMFFGGDLNYRSSDSAPKPHDFVSFPQPGNDENDIERFAVLFAHDQLNRERKAGRTLHNLEEAPVHFPPTYKYSKEQHKHNNEDHWHWAEHRYPSWTDRILFSGGLAGSKYMDVLSYDALALQSTSDHRPVGLVVKLDLACTDTLNAPSPFSINPSWRSQRAVARILEIGVGVLAYLGLTWEGRILLLSVVVGGAGGWLILRSLIS